MKKALWFAVLASVFSGCTWVKLNKSGESVAVVQSRYVKSCEYIGNIKAKVIVDVGGVKRSRNKVARELETLARNDANGMKGDTIVIASPITTVKTSKYKRSASRVFKVYRCGAAGK